MNWICASCGLGAGTNRRKCSRCGGALWKPAPKKDLIELAGPLRRISTKGLLLGNQERHPITESSNCIECGKCHTVIYRTDKGFDLKALEEARSRHYSSSPKCME